MLDTHRILQDSPETKRAFYRWNEEMLAQNDPDNYLFSPWRIVRWVERWRVNAVLRLLHSNADSAVLELGCGSGQLLNQVHARARTGVDASQHLIRRAQANVPGAHFVRADAEKLPFCDGAFERVFCSSVLSHVLNPVNVLAEGFRVLKPGGRFVVSVPNADCIERGVKLAHALQLHRLCAPRDARSVADRFRADYHLHRFSRAYLLRLAASLPSPARIIAIPSRALPLHLAAMWMR